jgi:hypothetical protein
MACTVTIDHSGGPGYCALHNGIIMWTAGREILYPGCIANNCVMSRMLSEGADIVLNLPTDDLAKVDKLSTTLQVAPKLAAETHRARWLQRWL